MASKFLWCGLTAIVAVPVLLAPALTIPFAGAVAMIVGCVIVVFEK